MAILLDKEHEIAGARELLCGFVMAFFIWRSWWL
jgi:hypothetical protein